MGVLLWDVSVVLSCADFNGCLNEIPRLIKLAPHWWGMPDSNSFLLHAPQGPVPSLPYGKKKKKKLKNLKAPFNNYIVSDMFVLTYA